MSNRRPQITVVGSLNMDLVVTAPRMPAIGETIHGSTIHYIPGGKGANQAVGCARLGSEVYMVGAVGDDAFGTAIMEQMKTKGVNMEHVSILDSIPTGTATILHLPSDNCIVVVPGANGSVTPDMVYDAKGTIEASDVLLVQLEIPLPAVERALKVAKAAGVITVLNPAPAQVLPVSILRLVDYITPNESEFSLLCGGSSESAVDLVDGLARWKAKYGSDMIVTRGKDGVSYLRDGHLITIPAPQVTVVDTVGAGDCFNAAFGHAIAEGRLLEEALSFAVKAASISVTRFGAQDGMPTKGEVDAVGETNA